jgi:CPA2 family monovalent cation:H+ antiporter-2
LIGGGLQGDRTVVATAVVAAVFGIGLRTGVFLGCLAALSSTAIVLKAYSDRNELVTPQGVLVASMLLFQDVCLAPMIVLTPVLAGAAARFAVRCVGALGLGCCSWR